MIKPTIGRVILFHPNKKSELVYPALVCFVHNDALINVGGFDNNGNAFGATSVALLQDGDEAPDFGAYAEWMPYQKQVADGKIAPTLHAVPGVSGSAGMEEIPQAPESAVIPPAEVDELMTGAGSAPDAGKEVKEA